MKGYGADVRHSDKGTFMDLNPVDGVKAVARFGTGHMIAFGVLVALLVAVGVIWQARKPQAVGYVPGAAYFVGTMPAAQAVEAAAVAQMSTPNAGASTGAVGL